MAFVPFIFPVTIVDVNDIDIIKLLPFALCAVMRRTPDLCISLYAVDGEMLCAFRSSM